MPRASLTPGLAVPLALLVLASTCYATDPSARDAPTGGFALPRGRDLLLLDCALCDDGDASGLETVGVQAGSHALYAGAFELSWEGLDEVRSAAVQLGATEGRQLICLPPPLLAPGLAPRCSLD